MVTMILENSRNLYEQRRVYSPCIQKERKRTHGDFAFGRPFKRQFFSGAGFIRPWGGARGGDPAVVTCTYTAVRFDILQSINNVLHAHTSMMWLSTLLPCMMVLAKVIHTIPTMRTRLVCAVTPFITLVIPCDPV